MIDHIVDALATAAEDGPLIDRGLVVMKADPELSESVRLVRLVLAQHPEYPDAAPNVRAAIDSLDRAARMIGGEAES
jgi:hypothetical protein